MKTLGSVTKLGDFFKRTTLKSSLKIFGNFWGYKIILFLYKNHCDYFLGQDWRKLGYFLFQHLVTLTMTIKFIFSVPPTTNSSSPVSHQSFIASVNLRTWILWSGGIKAVWDKALASNKNEDNSTASRPADQYSISLKKIGGKDCFFVKPQF